jgi:uroporphyrinogen decarboxylase
MAGLGSLCDQRSAMTHKERMRRALGYQPVDHLPTQINYTQAMGEKLAAHFGVALADLPAQLGNHLLRLDLSYPGRLSPDGKVKYDWWGVGFSTEEEGYLPTDCPLADSKDLDAFPWPDPRDPRLLEGAARAVAADQGEHFIVPNFGFCLFERAWSLRRFDTFLVDLVLDPDFAEEVLERITEIQLVLIRRFIELGVDGGYFGDDYGSQKATLFSPQLWRGLFKPRLARMFAPFREAGLPVLMHSDGNIRAILPDLVEIGLTAYNPVQPEVIDHAWLRETFGDRLAYYGGISTQTVLPFGTPAEVKAAVAGCVRTLAPHRSGLVVAPSHRMLADIPLQNVEALLDAFATLEDNL